MVLELSKQQYLDLLLVIRSVRHAILISDQGELELDNSDKTLKISWDPNTIIITID